MSDYDGYGKEGGDDIDPNPGPVLDPDAPAWVIEAREKKLPALFIERLQASDGVTEVEKARLVASVQTARDLELKRAAAVEIGRRHGEAESASRGEIGADRDGRIRRAMAYAAWEFDGKPLSSRAQAKEFQVPGQAVTGSLERGSSPRLLRKEDRK